MHAEVKQFLSRLKGESPEVFQGKSVLELGSFDINGSPREFFDNCEYVGVDRRAGKGVDVVCLAHEYKSRKKFDVVISTEMLEHDKYADETIKNAWGMLKKGGWLICTAANVNRASHYEEVGEDGYYNNVSREMVEEWIKLLDGVEKYTIEEDERKQDIRFVVVKK